MMTTEQIKTFEELLMSPDFKGKDQLKHLLWLNTIEPKYKKGDCFMVTDPSHKIYGNPVINFKAKVIRIFTWKNTEEYHYELEMECECNGNRTTSKAYKSESQLNVSVKCQDNYNQLDEMRSKHSDQIDL